MKKSAREMTGFNNFIKRLPSFSPYSSFSTGNMQTFTDKADLEKWYDSIELLHGFINDEKSRRDRLEYHLTRLPKLPSMELETFSIEEIFLFKRFLYNLKNIASLVDGEIKKCFSLEFVSERLLQKLSLDGSSESFHICDGFSKDLELLRSQRRDLDEQADKLFRKRIAEIRELSGHDFSRRDFLILNAATVTGLSSPLLYLEPYDSGCFRVKPVMPEEYYQLIKLKDEKSAAEKEAENKILVELTRDILNCKDEVNRYTEGIRNFERAWITARAAIEYKMIRPEITSENVNPQISGGRFLPLLFECRERGIEYQTLSFTPKTNVSIIRGSNMSGKTVLIKSMGFFQLLVLYGFFVPAHYFRTSLYNSVEFISGKAGEEDTRGLSGFGMEIRSLAEVLSSGEENQLLLIDEFASTTTSDNSKALTEALIEAISEEKNISLILTTHIYDLELSSKASLFRMAGLIRDGLKKNLTSKEGEIEDRIKLLNNNMKYKVEQEKTEREIPDALIIAECLGLNKNIITRAAEKMGLNYEEFTWFREKENREGKGIS